MTGSKIFQALADETRLRIRSPDAQACFPEGTKQEGLLIFSGSLFADADR
ncbi:MAG: hypothetical protein GWN87_20810 [Desulfuromonadales bacterium]|nr:hypothetical protein [Desulfuromonadales bacterium]NIS42426.1 hypothetical protein [Desulfuromonadales bacterium]